MNITASRLQYLNAIGVQVWEERAEPAVIIEAAIEPERIANAVPDKLLQQADWFVVKDSSNSQQDAEHLFSNICLAGKIPQASLYVTTVNAQSAKYRQQVLAEIQQVQPKVILVFGERAAQCLLKSNANISELRGRVQKMGDISTSIIITHSPSDLITTPLLKRETWADLQLAIQVAKEESTRGTH